MRADTLGLVRTPSSTAPFLLRVAKNEVNHKNGSNSLQLKGILNLGYQLCVSEPAVQLSPMSLP